MITKKITMPYLLSLENTALCCQVKICFTCSKPLKIDKLSVVNFYIK